MLQVVGGYTEIMRTKLPDDSPLQHALQVNARVIERAARLVRQLMLFGRRGQTDVPERFSCSGYTPDIVGQMLTPEDTAALLRKPYSIKGLLHRVRSELDRGGLPQNSAAQTV